jgi:hypothetical protein
MITGLMTRGPSTSVPAYALFGLALLLHCGPEFTSVPDDAGATASGSAGGDPGSSASSGEGGASTASATASATASGVGGTGGGTASSGSTGSGGAGGGACSELTAFTLQNPGFESGTLAPGWQGSGNYPQYASVTAAAALTGSHGAELNDTGVGVPGIEQMLLPVSVDLVGQTVSVTAWVRLVSFPGVRLLLEANLQNGVHLDLQWADTVNDVRWQKLTTQITIPATTDHLMIKIVSTVAEGDGVAYADDVQLCMGDACSPCVQ